MRAARALIQEDGLGAVSLRVLARRLGVTAPALYAYVDDKRDLLLAVADGEFSELVGRFERVEAADPVERVRSYCRVYLEYAQSNPELYEVMFLFPPELTTATATGNETPLATKAFAVPAAGVVEAIEQGAFRDLDPLHAALVVWTAMHGLAHVLRLGFGFDRETEDQLVGELIDTVMRGLCRG